MICMHARILLGRSRWALLCRLVTVEFMGAVARLRATNAWFESTSDLITFCTPMMSLTCALLEYAGTGTNSTEHLENSIMLVRGSVRAFYSRAMASLTE